jgi:porin
VKPTAETYIAVAAYDGIPGDARTTSGDDIHFNNKDGLLLVGELGFSPEADAKDQMDKLAVGVWHYTGGIPELIDPAQEGTAEGFYALASKRFYHQGARNLGAYLRGGAAADATAQTNWDLESGIVANGWMPSRPDSEIGAGVALAHNGDAYMTAQEAAAVPAQHMETAYELYYRDTVARGVNLQPDMQYIVNPGTNPALADAWLVGMRLDVAF